MTQEAAEETAVKQPQQWIRTVAGEQKQFLRFSRLNRVLHIVMIVSFISLALTGMTLKFSYTGWA